MAKIIKDGGIINDPWQFIGLDEAETQPLLQDFAHTVLSVAAWRDWDEAQISKESAMATPGLWIEAEQRLEDIEDIIQRVPLIAVRFPSFVHGIGFSIASILRENYKFPHEIRAFDAIIPDQTPYLRRCGFNSFAFAKTPQLELGLKYLLNSPLTYQGSVFSGRTPFQFRYSTELSQEKK